MNTPSLKGDKPEGASHQIRPPQPACQHGARWGTCPSTFIPAAQPRAVLGASFGEMLFSPCKSALWLCGPVRFLAATVTKFKLNLELGSPHHPHFKSSTHHVAHGWAAVLDGTAGPCPCPSLLDRGRWPAHHSSDKGRGQQTHPCSLPLHVP